MTAKRRLIPTSPPTVGSGARGNRGRRRLAVAALVMALAGTAAVAGCAPAPPKPEPGTPSKLHPVGDPGSWAKDTYAGWKGDTYATPNTVCGISGDVVIEFEKAADLRDHRVVARSLADSRTLWAVTNARCSVGSVGKSEALIGAAPAGSYGNLEWRTVVPSTGKQIQSVTFSERATTASRLTEVGGVTVYVVDGSGLVGMSAGKEVWRTKIEGNATATALADGAIGLSPGLQKELRVIDGATGKELHTAAVEKHGEIAWASDGYSSLINQSDPAYAFFDVHGTEVDRTKGISQYGFVPRPREGITFPVRDHIAAGRVVGVAADGTPALFQDARQRDFTAAGAVPDLPDSIISLAGLSANGKVLFFTPYSASGLAAIDPTGKTIFTLPLDFDHFAIESGYIVLSSDHSTHVLLPPA